LNQSYETSWEAYTNNKTTAQIWSTEGVHPKRESGKR
jgi:hypothetical protein